MDQLPDSLLLHIFSYLHWRVRLKLESVSTRWNKVLHDSSLRYIGRIDLNSLVRHRHHPELPRIISSLVVTRSKTINHVCSDGINTYTVMTVLGILQSTRWHMLTGLELDVNSTMPSSSFNSFFNLKVLKLRVSNGLQRVDLSELLHLKVLEGEGVHFINCRSLYLDKLIYRVVDLNCSYDYYHFQMMINAAADRIEHFELDNVKLSGSTLSVQPFQCKMPWLEKLVLREIELFSLSIDLAWSTHLVYIDMFNCNCAIVNLDLSIHCLEYFIVDQDEVVNEFIVSVSNHPLCFSFLKHFSVVLESSIMLNELFYLVASFEICSLRWFHLSVDSHSMALHDLSDFVTLIQRSPNLKCLDLNGFLIDKDCFINFIVSIILVVNDLDLEIMFDQINFCSELSFISDLYNALSTLDPFVFKCHNKVYIKYLNRIAADWSDFMIEMRKIMKYRFYVDIL